MRFGSMHGRGSVRRSTITRVTAVFIGLAISAVWLPAAWAAPIPRSPEKTWQTNGRVRAVEFSPDGNTVYLAGNFTAVRPAGAPDGSQEVARNRAAAFNVATNSLLPWNPNVNNTVWSLSASPDGTKVYLGGSFTEVGGARHNRFAAVTAGSSGAVLSGTANASGVVRSVLASPDGKRVYIGGQFGSVSGSSHRRVAALNANGSVDQSFNATVTQISNATCPPRCSPVVASLALSPGGSTLYIGGHFGLINGVGPLYNAASVDAATGTNVGGWRPEVYHETTTNTNQKNTVYVILPYGDHVYICGDWHYVNNRVAANIASTYASNGSSDTAFRGQTDGGTPACAISGGLLYMGGHFLLVNDVKRTHIAAVTLTTGALDSWNPSANSSRGLHALEAYGSGSSFRLAAGGDFTKIGGVYQEGFALFKP